MAIEDFLQPLTAVAAATAQGAEVGHQDTRVVPTAQRQGLYAQQSGRLADG